MYRRTVLPSSALKIGASLPHKSKPDVAVRERIAIVDCPILNELALFVAQVAPHASAEVNPGICKECIALDRTWMRPASAARLGG